MKYWKATILLTDDCVPEPLTKEDIRDSLEMQGTAGIEIKQMVFTEHTEEQFKELCKTNGENNGS